MGVSGLTSYICKNVPEIKVKIKLLQEIRDYLKQNKKRPLILIESSCLSHLQGQDYWDVFSGQRWNSLVNREKRFLLSLIEAGADLVFFLEAPNKDEACETWFKRKTENFKRTKKVVFFVETQNTAALNLLYEQNQIEVPAIHGKFYRQELRNIGTWKSCFDDVDFAIAQYAKDHNAFMVFTNDSDFLIFEGDFRKMCYLDIDYEEMTTTEIQRSKLRKHLGLRSYQMALFSTFCGNDVVDRFNGLKNFHLSLGKNSKFLDIAKKVKEIMPDCHTDRSKVVKKAANLIGMSTDKISASLKQYDLTSNYSPNIEKSKFLQKLLEHDEPIMYIALKGYPKRISPLYENIEKPYFKKSQVELGTHIYRCILGILYQHKKSSSNDEFSCPVFTISENEYKEIKVKPEFPQIKVPELNNLIFRKDNDALDPIRYDLLKWALSRQSLKVHEIMKIEQKPLIPVILTLNFLSKHAKLSTNIANMLLLTFYKIYHDDIPEQVPSPKTLNYANFQATWMFFAIQATIMELLSTIGLHHLARLLPFDGHYFHHKSALFAKMDTEQQKVELLPIKNLRKFYE